MAGENISVPAHCVIIPFFNRLEQVATCLKALLSQAKPNTIFLLVDDGSTPPALRNTDLQSLLSLSNVHWIRHANNYGVAAARNSGLHWCRRHRVDIVIMIDSDCTPEENVIDEHLRLHKEHPDAVCIGGKIAGHGKSLWAKLDGITSWVHASPHKISSVKEHEFRRVEHPYHLPTTNFSAKLGRLPQREFVFDERLKTGEDCLLVRELRRHQQSVYFSSTPVVHHHDREKLCEVFRHHYEWGHHQYFIQLGGDISTRCFNPFYRLFFFCLFLPVSPLFALIGTLVNCKPLLSNNSYQLVYLPLIYCLWFGKAIAVLEACVWPHACLRQAREHLTYEEARREK